jgi:hypothetical protein
MTTSPGSRGLRFLKSAGFFSGLTILIGGIPGYLWYTSHQDLAAYKKTPFCESPIPQDKDISNQCIQSIELQITGLLSSGIEKGIEFKMPDGSFKETYLKEKEVWEKLHLTKLKKIKAELWHGKVMSVSSSLKNKSITLDNPEYKNSNAEGGFLGIFFLISILIGGFFTWDIMSNVLFKRKKSV